VFVVRWGPGGEEIGGEKESEPLAEKEYVGGKKAVRTLRGKGGKEWRAVACLCTWKGENIGTAMPRLEKEIGQ